MAEELRNIYNPTFIDELSTAIKKEYSLFNSEKCKEIIFQEDWTNLALKQRMRRITISLFETLPKEYSEALNILYKVAPQFSGGLEGLIFPDYVELYGLNDWDKSLEALAYFTPLSTSEFAVRPFLVKNKERMLKQMLQWSTHPNHHVRRLASEGSRPRLPWGKSVPSLKEHPEQTYEILNNLKADETLYVRKSVANHINDISYTHPEMVLEIAENWYGKNGHTDWIVKHSCRSLLKKGNKRALALFGFHEDNEVEVKDFKLEKKSISIGENILFSLTITSKMEQFIRIEYSIDYVKLKGQRTRKVFMISSGKMKANETRSISKQQSFKDMTTRKHYKGIHTLSIIINGKLHYSLDFEII